MSFYVCTCGHFPTSHDEGEGNCKAWLYVSLTTGGLYEGLECGCKELKLPLSR